MIGVIMDNKYKCKYYFKLSSHGAVRLKQYIKKGYQVYHLFGKFYAIKYKYKKITYYKIQYFN